LADSSLAADSLAGFEAVKPELHAKFRSAALSLKKMEARQDGIDFTDILKATSPQAFAEIPADLGKAMREMEFIKRVTLNELKDALVEKGVPAERIISLREPISAYQMAQLKNAYDESRNRLFRYEQRYGPGAPRLNIAEAGLAYLLQGLYPFGPNRKGPGPLEPVARYSTSWVLTYSEELEDIPRAFTVGALYEFGLRWYWYSAPDARPGFWGLLKPNFLSAGYAMAASNRPWFFLGNDESFDPGFFVDVGLIKVAMTFGDYSRVFVGKQFQFIPYLF